MARHLKQATEVRQLGAGGSLVAQNWDRLDADLQGYVVIHLEYKVQCFGGGGEEKRRKPGVEGEETSSG